MVRCGFLVGTSLLLACTTCIAQNYQPTGTVLQKSNGKEKRIKWGKGLSVSLTDTTTTPGLTGFSHVVHGGFEYFSNDTLWLADPSEEMMSEWDGLHRTYSTYATYEEELPLYPIPAYRVKYIEIDETTGQVVGQLITGLGLLGAIVVAPLVGYNYNGTFSGERYLNIVGPCLIGVGVGLIVNWSSDPGRLHLPKIQFEPPMQRRG